MQLKPSRQIKVSAVIVLPSHLVSTHSSISKHRSSSNWCILCQHKGQIAKTKTKVPQANEIADLVNKGLAKTGDLSFPADGDHNTCNDFILEHVPRPFQYLKDNGLTLGANQLDWQLLTWRERTLAIYGNDEPTGRDFQSAKSRVGGSSTDSKIFVGMYFLDSRFGHDSIPF